MVFKPILTKKDIKRISSEFKKILKKEGIKVSYLILFGSYARGNPHPWSDVDIGVVSNKFGKKDFDDMARISKLAKQVNYLIEAHPFNPMDLKKDKHPLASEVKKTGIKM